MPDRAKPRWWVVAAYALTTVANQMLWLTFAPIDTATARHYHVSVGAVGWLSQVSPLVYIILAIPAGLLLDRWFRSALAFGAIFTAIGAVVRLGGDTFEWALAGQVLIAVAQPFVLNSVSKLSVVYLPEGARPLGIALGSAAIFLGMVLGLTLSPLLSSGGNIERLILAQSLFSLAAAPVLLIALRTRPSDTEQKFTSVKRNELRAIWRDHTVRYLAALAFVGFGVFIALTTWLEALLSPAGVSDKAAGVLLVAMVVAGVVGSAVFPAPVAKRRAQRQFLLAAAGVTSVGCLAVGAAPLLGVRAVVLAIMGLFMLAALPVILEATEERTEAEAGTAAAVIWFSGNIGGLGVAVIVQALVHQPMLAFVVMAAVMLAGVPFALKLPAGASE